MNNKIAIAAFICSAGCIGGAIYKFFTTGVTVSPFMLLGIGACFTSLGIIKAFSKETK